MYLLVLVYSILKLLYINAISLENDSLYLPLGPKFSVSHPRQFPNKQSNRDITKIEEHKINQENHLQSMLWIEEFFMNVSELPCVKQKRQNIERITGKDPFLLFD